MSESHEASMSTGVLGIEADATTFTVILIPLMVVGLAALVMRPR